MIKMSSAGGFIGLWATIDTYTCDICGYKLQQRSIYKMPVCCPKCGVSWDTPIKHEKWTKNDTKKLLLIIGISSIPLTYLTLILIGVIHI